VSKRPFLDHYESLQLSPNADGETVERVYRLLAKRYHPDNQITGNVERFTAVQEAYEVLGHPERRAGYDAHYDENRSRQWKIFDQGSAADGREEDRRIFHGILSLLYVAKRRDPKRGGLGVINVERMLGVPQQHLEFPMWYLKEHGWVEIQDNGQLAITVQGVDKLADRELELPANRLLTESSLAAEGSQAEGQPAVKALGPEG
jgi:curved DNA-binding protein